MKRVSLGHWFVRDNRLEIALMHFYVCLDIEYNNCVMSVFDEDANETRYKFNSLEDAIKFTEEFIASCNSIQAISETYKVLNNDDAKKNVYLNPEVVDEALFEYFSQGKDYNVSVKEELSIENNQPKIDFYLLEHLKYGDMVEIAKTKLTEEDLYKAFNFYVKDLDYEVKDFKYIGGIHRVGYSFDQDTPHYEGIQLSVITKKQEKILNRKV